MRLLQQQNQGEIMMPHIKFNGVLKEITEAAPDFDVADFLGQSLQIADYKAEELATRIKEKYQNKKEDSDDGCALESVLEEPKGEFADRADVFPLDSLSDREFERFIKWLLVELGYEIQPDQCNVSLCFDFVAIKDEERILVQARKYPQKLMVSNFILLSTEKTKRRIGCQKAIVLATAYFTEKTIVEAEKSGVELWNIVRLSEKIDQTTRKGEVDRSVRFPEFRGSLLQSIQSLEETEQFIIEPKGGGKHDLHLLGVKVPLLTFWLQSNIVVRCIYRIRNNEPVGENEGVKLLDVDKNGCRVGPDDTKAYDSIRKYLEEALK
jgi:HJR/Mrr/RecB family endonuclease